MAKSPEEKLARALKAKAVLTERSKRLQEQLEDFRKREEVMGHVASELVERQRELNFMLHRASSVLHQLQDTNLALSAEFTHLTKELPTPEGSDIETTINKVNELFQKTHELAGEMQDEIFRTTDIPKIRDNATESADTKATQEAETNTQDEALIEAEIEDDLIAETDPPAEQDKSVEELFRRVQAVDIGDEDSEASQETPKKGMFSRLFGRRDGESQ